MSVGEELSPRSRLACVTPSHQRCHLARHVRHLTSIYAERQEHLVAALRDRLSDRLDVVPARSGMHLVAYMNEGDDDVDIARRAALAGVDVEPRSFRGGAKRCGLLFGFAATGREQMLDAVATLGDVFASAQRKP